MENNEIDVERLNTKYSVFMDLLGYGSIVMDESRSVNDKVDLLSNYFVNISTSMSNAINEVNKNVNDKIYIRSFSDSFYLDTTNLIALLHVCNQVLNDTFGFYANVKEEIKYTPLLRAGLAKGWTVNFHDVGAAVNNELGLNPVGTGIAKAYGISEKTKLSGMRFIIEDQVISDLGCTKKEIGGDEYFLKEYTYSSIPHILYFRKINRNELFMTNVKGITLYEMMWPVRGLNSCTLETVDLLLALKKNFDKKNMRHYKMTAELFYKSLQLTDCKHNIAESYSEALNKLKRESKLNLGKRASYALQHLIK